MTPIKIAVIGAGSASFGPTTLATIIREPELRGSELALIDQNEAFLETVFKVAERMNHDWGAEMTIRAGSERRKMLPGSDFVVVSIEVVPRERLWQLDWEIPLKHGLRQPYAENGGPGGLMHACRQIPVFMRITADMEELCPQAWLINFSNPLPRITRAISKYSKIKSVGKCHQIRVGYAIVATLLQDRIPTNATTGSIDKSFDKLVEIGRRHFDIKSAGLNHFIWLLEIRDKRTGENLYPILQRVLETRPKTDYPLTMELFRIFGYCPIAGDSHLAEYLPWLHDPDARPWEKYNINLYDWRKGEKDRSDLVERMRNLSSGEISLDQLRASRSEGAAELIKAIGKDQTFYDESINIPNRGYISNLPDETIVEIPGIADGSGVRGVEIGELPEPIAELMRREASLVEMVVDTAVSGDKQLALQTLLLDPMINDIDRARAILDDYLDRFADFLPQFQ